MKVKIGPLDVFTSGSLLIEIGKPIEIFFGDVDNLKFIFRIVEDSEKEKFKSAVRLISNKEIELDLINFIPNGTGGGGTKYPVKIVTLQKRALYYSITLQSISKNIQPLFTYTFYLGEAVSNG